MNEEELTHLLSKQIQNNFLLTDNEAKSIPNIVQSSLLRTEKCFIRNNNKYDWTSKGRLILNPFYPEQYSIFLYYASQEAAKSANKSLADRIFFLNQILNGCNLYYEVNLPDIFFLVHPIGSVMGPARYSNYFIFQQNCTVGANNGIYPSFGEFVWLFANATVIGNTTIGSNVFVSAGAYIKDEIIPDNTIVFGRSPNLILKSKEPEYFYKASPFKLHQEILAQGTI